MKVIDKPQAEPICEIIKVWGSLFVTCEGWGAPRDLGLIRLLCIFLNW